MIRLPLQVALTGRHELNRWSRSARARAAHSVAGVALLALLLQGSAEPAWGQFSVLSLESTNPKGFGHFSWSVAAAGDVDGDGHPDVIVGAPNEDGALTSDGRAYLFSGLDGVLLSTLTSPAAEINGSFGISVAGLDDLDGDRIGDVAVGAYRENEPNGAFTAGHVYVFSGASGRVLLSLASPNAESGGHFGWSVSAAGDVDGDGVDDLIVGALDESGGATRAGRAYLFSGADGSEIHTLESPDPEADGAFGNDVSSAGDVNADGRDDVIVGAWSEGSPGVGGTGNAYVFDGRDGTLLHTLSSPDPEVGGFFGRSVSGAGDVDEDGRAEVIVGAYFESDGVAGAGRVHVFRGEDGGLLRTLGSPDPEVGGRFGEFVTEVGDVDRDGVTDWLVGAPAEDGGAVDAGRVYLFSGRDGVPIVALRSPSPEEFALFGFSGAGPGDVNDDGVTDVFVGTFAEDGAGFNDGRAHLYVSALETPDLELTGTCPGEVTVRIADQTPRGSIVLFAADRRGETILAGGPCVGTVLDLAAPGRLGVFATDELGAASAMRDVDNPAACRAFFQAVDLTTCEVTNLAGL